MAKKQWRCEAESCRAPFRAEGFNRVWRCGRCKKLYHAGCSGGAPYPHCDACFVAEGVMNTCS